MQVPQVHVCVCSTLHAPLMMCSGHTSGQVLDEWPGGPGAPWSPLVPVSTFSLSMPGAPAGRRDYSVMRRGQGKLELKMLQVHL